MSASIDPVLMRQVEAAILTVYESQPQRVVAAVINRNQAAVSRALTAKYDDNRPLVEGLTAEQLVSLMGNMGEINGAVQAVAHLHQRGTDDIPPRYAVMNVLQEALNSAKDATNAIAESGPGGIEITPQEAQELSQRLRKLISVAATAMLLMGGIADADA